MKDSNIWVSYVLRVFASPAKICKNCSPSSFSCLSPTLVTRGTRKWWVCKSWTACLQAASELLSGATWLPEWQCMCVAQNYGFKYSFISFICYRTRALQTYSVFLRCSLLLQWQFLWLFWSHGLSQGITGSEAILVVMSYTYVFMLYM